MPEFELFDPATSPPGRLIDAHGLPLRGPRRLRDRRARGCLGRRPRCWRESRSCRRRSRAGPPPASAVPTCPCWPPHPPPAGTCGGSAWRQHVHARGRQGRPERRVGRAGGPLATELQRPLMPTADAREFLGHQAPLTSTARHPRRKAGSAPSRGRFSPRRGAGSAPSRGPVEPRERPVQPVAPVPESATGQRVAVSTRIVTGPSLTRCTAMSAPNTPVCTSSPYAVRTPRGAATNGPPPARGPQAFQ